MPEDLGDRTEAPSGRRLSEARENGNIPRSQEFSAAVDLIVALIVVATLGASLAKAFRSIMENSLNSDPSASLSFAGLLPILSFAAWHAAIVALPILGLVMLFAILVQLSQVGLHFSTTPLMPKFSRLNPMSGIKNLFNVRSLMKTGINSLKLAAALFVGWLFLSSMVHKLSFLPMLSASEAIHLILTFGLSIAKLLLTILLAIGIIDFFYQRWKHKKDLRMTKQEVKDERRSMEGDPAIKGHRFKMYQKIILQRINSAVPKADVVVTNPTHYSIAIKYDAKSMRAPRVVAKGVDYIAMEIRKIAVANGVPIVERPPLARALYAATEAGQEIEPKYYQAVAEILAYVYRLEKEMSDTGDAARDQPASRPEPVAA